MYIGTKNTCTCNMYKYVNHITINITAYPQTDHIAISKSQS